MTPRTLFTIVLKIFGLSLIYGLLDVIPAWIRRFITPHNDLTSMIIYIIWVLLALTIYFIVVWASLFRTTWIVDKLKLDKAFDQESINIRIEGTSIIRIALIVLGGMMLIIAIPNLFSDFVYFYKLKKESVESEYSYSGLSMRKIWDSVNLSMAVFNAIRILIGMLLLILNNQITNWLTRKTENKVPPTGENIEQ